MCERERFYLEEKRMSHPVILSDNVVSQGQGSVIRWFDKAVKESRNLPGFSKLENDEAVVQALQSNDKNKLTRSVRKWHTKTNIQIFDLKMYKLIRCENTSDNGSITESEVLANLILWSRVSQKCERLARTLTVEASKAIKPVTGVIAMILSVNTMLVTVTKLALKWSKVDKPGRYINWNYFSLLEVVLTLITPLQTEMDKLSSNDVFALSDHFTRYIEEIWASSGKPLPSFAQTPWGKDKTIYSNQEFITEAKKAIQSFDELSNGIKTFCKQNKPRNDVLAKKKIVGHCGPTSVGFRYSSPSAEFDGESSLLTIKPNLQSLYQNCCKICTQLDSMISELNGSVDVASITHHLYDECKSEPGSLGSELPDELLTFGIIMNHILKINLSGGRILSKMEAVLIFWIESKMKDQSNNPKQHVMSFLNDLKDDTHFLSQFKVVKGDISRLDYVEKKNRITCQKTCQEETSGSKDPKGFISNISKESKKLGAKRCTLPKYTTPKKKKKTKHNRYILDSTTPTKRKRIGVKTSPFGAISTRAQKKR